GAVKTAFSGAGQGTLTAGNATLTFKTYATLVSMQKFVSYGGTPDVVQTWEVTAEGGFQSSNAVVRVTATAERPKVPANSVPSFSTTPATNTVTVDSGLLGGTGLGTLATAAAACTSLGLTIGTNCDLQTATGVSATACAVACTYKKLVVAGTGADITLPNIV